MYSPRIREDLIPRIYHVAKQAGVAMTTWVNQVIEAALAGLGQTGGEERQAALDQKLVHSNRATPRGGQRP